MLTHDRLLQVLHYDPQTGLFIWKNKLAPRGSVGTIAGARGIRGRREIRIDGKLYLGHRLAWFYMHGEWPGIIDHADGDPANNQATNLRKADVSENVWNSRKRSTNTSGIKGVRYDAYRKKWTARLMANGEFKLLKRFATKEEASAAYVEASRKYHGDYSRID